MDLIVEGLLKAQLITGVLDQLSDRNLNTAVNSLLDNRFLQLLLGETGKSALTANGPTPTSPPQVSTTDYRMLPASLKPLVKTAKIS